MLDPKNVVALTCGIVADPEFVTENILKLRVAADYAGSERDSDNNSGYFDVTYFLNEGGRNVDFVRRQVNEGKLKKSSQVQILGRLVQERWKSEDGNRSRVVIVAESITYAGGGRPAETNDGPAQAAVAQAPGEF